MSATNRSSHATGCSGRRIAISAPTGAKHRAARIEARYTSPSEPSTPARTRENTAIAAASTATAAASAGSHGRIRLAPGALPLLPGEDHLSRGERSAMRALSARSLQPRIVPPSNQEGVPPSPVAVPRPSSRSRGRRPRDRRFRVAPHVRAAPQQHCAKSSVRLQAATRPTDRLTAGERGGQPFRGRCLRLPPPGAVRILSNLPAFQTHGDPDPEETAEARARWTPVATRRNISLAVSVGRPAEVSESTLVPQKVGGDRRVGSGVDNGVTARISKATGYSF